MIDSRYEKVSEIIKAVSHPTRLFIVDELKKGERCVCEIQGLVGSDMSTVSKHLKILKDADIVSVRRDKNNLYYSLSMICIYDFIKCVEKSCLGSCCS